MNAKELAKDVYDAVLRQFEGDTERDLEADDFDAVQDTLEEVINDATEATDDAEDAEDEDDGNPVQDAAREGYDKAIGSGSGK